MDERIAVLEVAEEIVRAISEIEDVIEATVSATVDIIINALTPAEVE